MQRQEEKRLKAENLVLALTKSAPLNDNVVFFFITASSISVCSHFHEDIKLKNMKLLKINTFVMLGHKYVKRHNSVKITQNVPPKKLRIQLGDIWVCSR